MSDYDFESKVIDIPDYPEPGVIFKDITPLFQDPEAFTALVDDIAAHFSGKGITKVVGAEARGFFIGPPVAYKMARSTPSPTRSSTAPMSCRSTRTPSSPATRSSSSTTSSPRAARRWRSAALSRRRAPRS